jgi:hypothetical protein
MRVTVKLFGSSPGIGINDTDWYCTETWVAVAESGPVMEDAVTTGLDPQVVTVAPMFGSPRISPKTIVQAVLESLAVALPVEVYSAAERAADCSVINAEE